MKTLIIGAGLVGAQLAKLEIEKKNEVAIFDIAPRMDALSELFQASSVRVVRGNILKNDELRTAIKEIKPDSIVHTVANAGLTLGAQEDPYDAVYLNIMGTENVLEASRIFGIGRVVFTSSNVIEHYQVAGPYGSERPGTVYATTKLACEHLGLNYADTYGLGFVAVRFSAVIGPWRAVGGGGPTRAFAELMEHAFKGEQAVFPRGLQEYVYSKDAALGCHQAVTAPTEKIKERVYRISMGRAFTGEEVVACVKNVFPSAHVDFVEKAAAGVSPMKMQRSDLDASEKDLGFSPQFDMAGAVNDYADWLKTRRG